MYGMPVNNGVSRIPKAERTFGGATTPLVRSVGTAVAQAAAVVIIAKIVDVLFEALMSRRRARQAQAPQYGHREEQPVS
jgi:hypothetical protein